MKIRYATISMTGNRFRNEDAFRVMEDETNSRWFGIVCDGMGGHSMGEVASDIVVSSISDYWTAHKNEGDTETKVLTACAEASCALDECAKMHHTHEMGTTMVMASIADDLLTIAHIGDSRCYVQRPDFGLLHRTHDHTKLSFGWDLIDKCFFSFRSEIAIPDITQIKIQSGDRILLCSDGLYKSIPIEILSTCMMDDKSPKEILNFFDSLYKQSGDDNYTAIFVCVE